MKAYEIQESFGISQLKMVDRPRPTPGPGEVLIQMKAVSLNYRDWLMVSGEYNPKQPLPLIPISDGVGEVIEVGANVDRFGIGDRVAGIFAQRWISGAISREKTKDILGGPLNGMLAELVVLPQSGVVKVPEHLTDIEASTLPVAATTAWRALVVESQIKAGDTVLLQGTGGVSLFALQFAKQSGARVIILSSSDEKLQRVRTLGADDTINYRDTPEWSKTVKELTEGVGVDVVVEVGGASTFAQSVQAIRMGGQINLIGQLGGGHGDINLVPLFMRNICVQGILVGSRDNFEEMNRAVALHQLRPVIDRVFAFDEAREALTYLEKGQHLGKVCIQIS